jgi:hypothetical protein
MSADETPPPGCGPFEPADDDAEAPAQGLDRRARLALIGLAALAAGLGVALALIVSDPPTEKVFVTDTVTKTTTPTTTTVTTSTLVTTVTTSTTTSTD